MKKACCTDACRNSCDRRARSASQYRERLSALSSAGQRIRQPLFFPMLNFAHRFDFLHYRFVPAPWLFSRSHIGLIAVVMSYATLRLNFLSRSEITRHRLRSLNDNILLRWRRLRNRLCRRGLCHAEHQSVCTAKIVTALR